MPPVKFGQKKPKIYTQKVTFVGQTQANKGV